MRRFLLFILLLPLLSSPLRLTVGDPFTLSFSKDVKFPPAFEVLGRKKTQSGYIYTLAIYVPGNYTIKAGDRMVAIEVVSVLKGGESLQEITPPMEVSGNPGWFLLRAGIFVGVFALLLGGFFLYRKISRRERDPWEVLLKKTEQLNALVRKGDLDALYSSLGEILREFLQLKFSLPAFSMTSGELAGKAPEPVVKVLQRADLVRFGGMAAGDPHRDVSTVLRLIREARDEILRS